MARKMVGFINKSLNTSLNFKQQMLKIIKSVVTNKIYLLNLAKTIKLMGGFPHIVTRPQRNFRREKEYF